MMLTGNEPVSAANLKAAIGIASGIGATVEAHGSFKTPEVYEDTMQMRIPITSSSSTQGASVRDDAIVVGMGGTYDVDARFSGSIKGIYLVTLIASIELHAGGLSVVLWRKDGFQDGVHTGDLSWSSTVAIDKGSEVYLLLKYERADTAYIMRLGVDNMNMFLSVSRR